MENCRQPAILKLEGDIYRNWRKFRQSFEIYMAAGDPEGKKENAKAAILLNAIGEEGVELYNTFQLMDEEKMNYEKIIQSFEDYCKPRRNVIIERYLFGLRNQHENEPFDHFVNDLKKMAATCEYENQLSNMIRDRIVIGSADKMLQERLLRIPDLTMEKAVEIGRTTEASKLQAETLSGKKVLRMKITGETEERRYKPQEKEVYLCRSCGTKHKWRDCPAYGKVCIACGKYNHFKKCCRNIQYRGKECKIINKEEDGGSSSNDENHLEINGVQTQSEKLNRRRDKGWKTKLIIEGKPHEVKLDTGAESNIITREQLRALGITKKLQKTTIMLVPWRGDKVKPDGIVTLQCVNRDRRESVEFLVVKATRGDEETILGGDSCMKLGYLKRLYKVQNNVELSGEEFIKKNKEQFEGEAKINIKWNLKINKNVVPVVNPPRRIPMAIERELKVTLEKLVERQIIVKVERPEGWINNIVIREKPNGSLRICLDPKELNNALIKESVLIPTVEEITSKLGGKKLFTVMDFREGFWQIGLTHESSKLCTFTTPFGTYRFRRLPFGLNVAPEIFQRINTQNFGDIPNVIIYFDDLLIMGETETEHDETLEKVMQRARQLGVKFNKDKLQYKQKEVKYLGYVISENGLRIDQDRIQAIMELKEPKTKKQLQKFLGIVGYLRRFIPRMSSITAPLRELLKKNRLWKWYPEHTRAVHKLKQEIVQATMLTTYRKGKELVIQTDASQSGLGSCLMQGDRPLAFASRSLTETESGYAQVEKEMLAIVFAVKKFHYYIYGNQTKVQTDHKPLVSIFKKKIADINSNRLQRLRLKTLKYELEVVHVPGKQMLAADLLSRDYIISNSEEEDNEEKMIHSIATIKHVSRSKLEEIKDETRKDIILQEVIRKMNTNWILKKEERMKEIAQYWNVRRQLSMEEGVLLHRGRLVIPKVLREKLLQLIHGGHVGIHKAKEKARQLVYWPRMSREIENHIKQCKQCVMYSNNNIKEPMTVDEKPSLPFCKVGADLLDYGGESYLTVVDYYSNWIELVKLKDKKTESVVKALKMIFSTHGIPQEIRADNMPFGSYEFRRFAEEWDIRVITSSPHYPKSNGLAERAVGIAKQMLRKSEGNKEDLLVALMEYRNTPLGNRQHSPAQLAMGRRLRTKLPIRSEHLRPQVVRDQDEYRSLQKRIRENYDKQARARTCLTEGETIVVRKEGKWIPGKVIEKCLTPNSYIISDQEGSKVRRNSYHLKKTKLTYEPRNTGDQMEDETVGLEERMTKGAEENKEVIEELKEDGEGDKWKTRSGRRVRRPAWMKDFVDK